MDVSGKAKPDYSGVTSREEASRLVATGELVAMQLLPRMFGGDDGPANVVFVPPFAAELKQRTDENVVRPAAVAGKVTQYNAVPSYAGNSFVPSSIAIRAHDPGEFNLTIAIWGESAAQ